MREGRAALRQPRRGDSGEDGHGGEAEGDESGDAPKFSGFPGSSIRRCLEGRRHPERCPTRATVVVARFPHRRRVSRTGFRRPCGRSRRQSLRLSGVRVGAAGVEAEWRERARDLERPGEETIEREESGSRRERPRGGESPAACSATGSDRPAVHPPSGENDPDAPIGFRPVGPPPSCSSSIARSRFRTGRGKPGRPPGGSATDGPRQPRRRGPPAVAGRRSGGSRFPPPKDSGSLRERRRAERPERTPPIPAHAALPRPPEFSISGRTGGGRSRPPKPGIARSRRPYGVSWVRRR